MLHDANSAAASPDGEWAKARNDLYEKLSMLSEFEARAAILLVYIETDRNSESLSRTTPKDAAWALKVLAMEHKLLSDLANEADWPELARWFQNNSDALITVIRGEISLQQFRRDQEKRKVEYQQIAGNFMRENEESMNGDTPPEFVALKRELITFVAASSRLIIGSESD